MTPIEEKAQDYAKKVGQSYGNGYASGTGVGEEVKQAYLQCHRDMMSMPLAERLTEEEKTKIKEMYHIANCDYGHDPETIRTLEQIFGENFFKPDFEQILEANKDVLQRIKEKGD